MNKPNFDRQNLREVANNIPVPDLGVLAARSATPVHPWAGIPINVTRIPDSCLYDIFLTESVDAANSAANIANALAAGRTPAGADGRPLPISVANSIMTLQLALAQQKATLAHACAVMAANQLPSLPRWTGPDGTLESGWANTYYETMIAERDAAALDTAETID